MSFHGREPMSDEQLDTRALSVVAVLLALLLVFIVLVPAP